MKARVKTPTPNIDRIESNLLVADVSDFTSLIYQASKHQIRRPATITVVLKGVQRFFHNAMSAAANFKGLKIINTTGDGLIATIPGPPNVAVEFAHLIREQFHRDAKRKLLCASFRHRVDLRIALHHGLIHRIEVKTAQRVDHVLYVGDDLNLAARVANSRIARLKGIGMTKAFMERLLRDDPGQREYCWDRAEVILDKNAYPEQIEVFPLP